MKVALAITCLTLVTILLNPVTEATSIQTNSARFDYNDFDQRILAKFFDDEYEEGEHDGGRVYYSHSMTMYGSEDSEIEKGVVRGIFQEFGIVSPKYYEDDPKSMMNEMARSYKVNDGKRIEEMEFYKTIVSSCQMLVYSEWKNEVPSGVAIEVNHAIDVGIPVFELDGDEFTPQKVHVDVLSYEETVKLYQNHETPYTSNQKSR